MMIVPGNDYRTRRGDTVSQLSYNRCSDDEPPNFTGRMKRADGSIDIANWAENGQYMGNTLEVPDELEEHVSDIVASI
jgi:hypothetical protein